MTVSPTQPSLKERAFPHVVQAIEDWLSGAHFGTTVLEAQWVYRPPDFFFFEVKFTLATPPRFDLNENPVLSYPDASFDVVTNCASVDYLTKPVEVCALCCVCSRTSSLWTTTTWHDPCRQRIIVAFCFSRLIQRPFQCLATHNSSPPRTTFSDSEPPHSLTSGKSELVWQPTGQED